MKEKAKREIQSRGEKEWEYRRIFAWEKGDEDKRDEHDDADQNQKLAKVAENQ